MEESNQGSIADPRIVELIEKYKKSHYGERWQPQAEKVAATIVQGIESRDYGQLHNLKYFDVAKFSRALFTLLTGIKLPKAQGKSDVVIREFCTVESIERCEFEQIKGNADEASERLRQQQVSYNGGIINGQQWVDAVVNEGFQHLEEEKGHQVKLCKRDQNGITTAFYLLKDWDFIAYATYVIKVMEKDEKESNQG